VKEQLLLLLELQTIDLKVRELDAVRKTLPARSAPLRNDLAKLEAMLDGEKQKLTDAEAWQRQQQAIQAREQDLLRAAKSKLQGTRTGKEFHAATREVEFKRKSINDREGELKKVTEALGSSGAVIGERDGAIQKLRDELAAEEARIATQLEEVAAADRGDHHGPRRGARQDRQGLAQDLRRADRPRRRGGAGRSPASARAAACGSCRSRTTSWRGSRPSRRASAAAASSTARR
jgi:predicted  nucleic acid-binding Zn-ribbon protein